MIEDAALQPAVADAVKEALKDARKEKAEEMLRFKKSMENHSKPFEEKLQFQ